MDVNTLACFRRKRCRVGLLSAIIILMRNLFVFHIAVLTSVVYILLMIFGLLGNMLTILVVWLRPYMRSSTYLYLSSMAVSDMLILLLLPLELYKVLANARKSMFAHALSVVSFSQRSASGIHR